MFAGWFRFSAKNVKRRYGMRPFCQTNMMDFMTAVCYAVYAAEDSAGRDETDGIYRKPRNSNSSTQPTKSMDRTANTGAAPE